MIENVGAGGMTGANRVKTAPPDGYMILLGTVGTQAQVQIFPRSRSTTPRRISSRWRCSRTFRSS